MSKNTELIQGTERKIGAVRIKTGSNHKYACSTNAFYPLNVAEDQEQNKKTEVTEQEKAPTSSRQNLPCRLKRTTSGTIGVHAVMVIALVVQMGCCGSPHFLGSNPNHCKKVDWPSAKECAISANETSTKRTVVICKKYSITINATYCSKVEGTICTSAFFRLVLKIKKRRN